MQIPVAHSLRGRFLLLVGGIFLAVLALAAGSFLLVTRGIITDLGGDYAAQYANRKNGEILAKVDREVVLARKLADSSILRRWCLDESNPELRTLALEELESYRKLFAEHSVFFVVDASRHYYFTDASDAGVEPRVRYTIERGDPTNAWYFDALEHIDDFALHVDNSAQLGVTRVWINAVVKDGDRKVGLGGTGLDLTEFIKDVVHSTQPGVETILVDSRGFVQGYSDVALMEANAKILDESKRLQVFSLLDSDVDRTLLRERLARLASGTTAVEIFRLGVGGRNMLAAATYMKGIDWAALILVDPSQVIQFHRFTPILLLLGGAMLATILLVSWSLDRLVLIRLARLTGSTREIAAGRYDLALPVDRPDEIGVLTESFNHMTATVLDYTRDLERKVDQRTTELTETNQLLHTSNRMLTDSISYARLIQGALLAKPQEIEALLPDSVVIWRPRNVVGGDFYALYPDTSGAFLVAVADCTGHGVPGAFMTMAAKALLDRAVAEHGIHDPAVLLTELNHSVRALLAREGQGGRNGLDLALVTVARDRSSLRFAGARLPLWIQTSDGRITAVPGDRQSLGYSGTDPDFVFSNRDLAVDPDDRVFLLSDGILDQPFGSKGFGLGGRRLQEALARWRHEPIQTLEAHLDGLLHQYEGAISQRDDITLVGFRLGAGAAEKEAP